MLAGRNTTGRPLAAGDWLAAHHRAKLSERQAFCRRLAALDPVRVVDLGCATGLWMEELNKVLPSKCEFVGLDSDSDALAEAEARSVDWDRRVTFEQVDITGSEYSPPSADLTLMFNVSSYLPDVDRLLCSLAEQSLYVAIRQYDGAALRFGPMDDADRGLIEQSLRAAISGSEQIRHYDLDRLFDSIHRAPFKSVDVEFELFQRLSPFPEEFMDYYTGTLEWTVDLLSDTAAGRLRGWMNQRHQEPHRASYFVEVDLVGLLS